MKIMQRIVSDNENPHDIKFNTLIISFDSLRLLKSERINRSRAIN